jgi:hypothetical protein
MITDIIVLFLVNYAVFHTVPQFYIRKSISLCFFLGSLLDSIRLSRYCFFRDSSVYLLSAL